MKAQNGVCGNWNNNVFFSLFFCILSIKLSIAQTPKIDSLENLLLKPSLSDTIKVDIMNDIAYHLLRNVNIDKAQIYSKKASALSDSIGYVSGKALSARLEGRYYLNKSLFDSSLINFKKSLFLFEQMSHKTGAAESYLGIAENYALAGNYYKSLEGSLTSLKLFEETKDQHGISRALSYVGSIYLYLGDYNQSLEYYNRSLKIQEEIGNKMTTAALLNNIAEVYQKQKKIPSAIENQKKCLALVEELGVQYFIVASNMSLGMSYQGLEDYLKAQSYFQKCLELSVKYGYSDIRTESFLRLAQIHFELQNNLQAKQYAEKALILAEKQQRLDQLKRLYETLSEISAANHEYEKAYRYHQKFKHANDSLFNEENTKKITGLEYQYEFDKEKQQTQREQQQKDKARDIEAKRQSVWRNTFIAGFFIMIIIVSLIYYNFIQKRKANLLLQEKYDENKKFQKAKDKIFSVISHDLRGPVGVIKSFTEMIETNKTSYSFEQIVSFVSLIGKQSSSIFNILENLLAWANSQQNNITIQLKQQQLINVVKNNVTLLEEMALKKHIDIKNNINPELSVIFDKNLISTVVRNLISNAIKFTPENGEIIIEAHKIKSLTTVTISDNGVGIPPEHIDHIFDNNSHYSTFGTASEKGSGLGLRLCRDFVKMHDGEIWIEKEVKKGSTFKFTLPHLKNKL